MEHWEAEEEEAQIHSCPQVLEAVVEELQYLPHPEEQAEEEGHRLCLPAEGEEAAGQGP
jgi:hypothetical protein